MNNWVPPWIARLLLMVPCMAFCIEKRTSNFWVFFICGLIWSWMMWQDTTVRHRWPLLTSPSNMILRAGLILCIPASALCFIAGGGFVNMLWQCFLVAIMGTGFFETIQRRLDHDYGWWANLPWLWNVDPHEARIKWEYVCPKCNAFNPEPKCICWRCNYGADGDSSAYYERYGLTKPDPNLDPNAPDLDPNRGPYGPIDPTRP